MDVLKVDEWQSKSGIWYVADVHTWTGWRECAEILNGGDTVENFCDFLKNKYKATIGKVCYYEDKPELILFWWEKDQYKNAHQFKLDVNRIARKKNYLVERSF